MVGARTWAEADDLAHATPRSWPSAGENSCHVSVGAAALDSYSGLCGQAVFSAPQSPPWTRAWAENVEPDYLVATIVVGGEPVFGLALEVTRAGPFKVARFMGGRHANGNFPAATTGFAESATASGFADLFRSIKAARPDIDIIALERMVPDFEGTPNPLLALPHSTSLNLSLELDLAPGFEAICGRSKRLRSKHRWQLRKFEAAGGYQRVEAATPEAVKTLLDEFFRQKEIRLKKMGVANIFGEPKIRRFFHALFANALGEEKPAFVLHALEIGGKVRAITGASRRGGRIACDLVSISEDDTTNLRPGEFLFYENIREAAEQGMQVYDFGVGDEPHKRRWCDVEVRHFDVIAPLSLKGHLLARGLRGANGLKAAVKNSPTLWKIVKSLRRRAPAETTKADESDE
jgi:CelD/BcsL family acetyltransferase involved in cellulose biosynthesis